MVVDRLIRVTFLGEKMALSCGFRRRGSLSGIPIGY
jgi:hypothetical protein